MTSESLMSSFSCSHSNFSSGFVREYCIVMNFWGENDVPFQPIYDELYVVKYYEVGIQIE